MLVALSWFAAVTGFAATWLCGRHRIGWLLSTVPATAWLIYEVFLHIWAGVAVSVISVGLCVRNYHVGRS